ncbi:hypothetical protein Drose_32335 [Dactylosporangium roseum]|uniref:Uncharacterized protein n=1 Tax=Dactylosporangium roseum TaxID=47989 RepID=A0ABY5Z3T7_9ACTN|nr:hypothetical protein [Dactylosporangium roseum]UWZ35743.1 hypothetical protein Drose_32335 [Dactylosporangium roseum]
MHQSRRITGCSGPDEGSVIDLMLLTYGGEGPRLLLEFPRGAEDGAELTVEQAESLAASMVRLLAEARS